jgi:hypothetical protein
MRFLGLALVAFGAAVAGVRDARACGGCFHGPSQTVTVITDHRMVFSISTTQTVLWDQIKYSGSASEFAWVLPVKPGATIQLSQDAWVASLDAATQTVIQSPPNNCGVQAQQDVGGGGGGCGYSSASVAYSGAVEDFDAGATMGSPVTVVSQQVVGPYDSVTVRSSQGEALGTWLRDNGYDVPQSIQPVIDAFSTQGFDFIALKLAPGEGVQAMQPVRVITPGADLSLPLRMVAAGVGAHVGVELFVLSEGRYEPQNFPLVTIDFSKLEWDPTNQISNYTTLASAALATNGGRGWLIESAGPANLYGPSNGLNPPLESTYMQTCTAFLLPPMGCGTPDASASEAGDDASGEGGDDASGGADGASVDAEAGASPEASASLEASAGDDAAACQAQLSGCDDLSLAMTGIDPGTLWITRMRADLPATALADDLVLQASTSQVAVPSVHQSFAYTTPGYNPCGSNSATPSSPPAKGACACRTSRSTSGFDVDGVGLGLAALGVSLALRGRARRRRRG